MNFQEFLENEKIPYLPFYYFISDKKKDNGELIKRPIKEKNDLTTDEIKTELIKRENMKKPKTYWIKENNNFVEVPLTKTELKTLTKSYTVFLKHSDYYCIDIDDKEIKTKSDYIQKLRENKIYEPLINIIEKCPWSEGNTKGIHIYLKLSNVPKYSNQQKVLNFVDGDFIKVNNMWERVDKKIHTYKGKNEFIFDCEKLKPLFKKGEIWVEQQEEKPKKKETKEIKVDELQNDKPLDETQQELKKYIELCIEHDVLKNITGYSKWLNIGFLIKNTFGNEGFDLFNLVSSKMPKYDGENETRNFYNDLNKRIYNQSKKPLTIGTLKLYVKEADENIYKTINNEMKQLIKGSGKVYEFDESKCYKFDTKYFNTLKNYEEKKQYFEIFVCKVLRPQCLYVYSEYESENKSEEEKKDKEEKKKGYNSLLYSESSIKETFTHLGSSIFRKTKDNEDAQETKFINEWINDRTIKLYNTMDFVPYNGTKVFNKDDDKDYFNLFNGYNKDIMTEYDESQTEQILKPFKDLVFELCGADKECFNYFYNFLGHLIQKPSERIPIAFIFKSKQGTGKNVMLDAIGNLISKAHYISSSNPKDFFGDYAEGFFRKLLININECEGKDTFDYEGKIKSFITEDNITLNPKFVRATTISNYARLIIFTNKPNPIPIDVRSKDRRFVVFQSTEKYLDKDYGTKFWGRLVNHFKNPKFVSCLYNDLNNIKLNDIRWKETRPITKAYIEMCKLYVPCESLFLENYIDNKHYNSKYVVDDEDEDIDYYDKQCDVPTTDLYKHYIKFCETYGYKKDNTFQASINKFTSRLNELDLNIMKVKTSENSMFRFTPKSTYKLMSDRKWIITKEGENEIDIEELKNIGGKDFDDYFIEL